MTEPKRILIVDDEPWNRDLLEAVVTSLGYTAECAATGSEALAKVRPDTDLVLLDVRMPDLDGFEVARRIRNTPEVSDIPIIMVTAFSGREDRLTAVRAGANDFIAKPADTLEVGVRMASLLKMKEAQDAIKRHREALEDTVEKRTAALRESERRFRALFETAQDCIFLKDHDGRYTDVNHAMTEMFQIPHARFIGKSDRDLFDEDCALQAKSLESRVLTGQTIETQQRLPSTPYPKTLNVVRFPIRDSSGKISGLCGIARDVTERTPKPAAPAGADDEHRSAAIRATLELIRLGAKSDSMVLFLGESGSGKDHFARYLHDYSKRAGGPFFSINCAALPHELAESELFGHEPGAFTGSAGRKRGLLELAEGGTLLLNEIGELPVRLQAKLLTFLDTQSFTRVGGEKSIVVNARLVAATNRNLEQEVQAGNFREDLYYRLSVFVIRVPPLRQRIEDIPVIARNVLTKLTNKMGLSILPEIDQAVFQVLAGYDWPGNVRELKNVLERALILCRGNRITLDEIGISRKSGSPSDKQGFSVTVNVSAACPLTTSFQEAKRAVVTEALECSGGNVTAAARLLGMSRDALRNQMRSLDIERP